MIIKITGTITDIFPVQTFGNFEKRVAWVQEETTGRYPNQFEIEFQQNDVNTLDSFVPGDVVECKIDVRGKKWEKNGKSGVINTLKCFEIMRKGSGPKFVPSTRNQSGGIPYRDNIKKPYKDDLE